MLLYNHRKQQTKHTGGKDMNKKMIMELVKNDDFFTVEEFYEALENEKADLINWLRWRTEGGTMKNETVSSEYIIACEAILAEIA